MNQLSYQQCYEILSLPRDVEWEEANKQFRKLVHQWHPDRYAGNDPKMAEQRFIELTTAFNVLRDFHKAEGSLPFAGAKIDLGDASNESRHPSRPHQARVTPVRRPAGKASDPVDAGIGNKQSRSRAKPKIPPGLIFAVIAASAAILVLVAFSSLDSKSKKKYLQEAEELRASESAKKP